MRVRLVLSLLLLTAAVTAWTGLDGEESDYIENTAESQEAEEAHDDTGNGHIDDKSDDDEGSDDGNDEDSDGDDDDNAGNDESEGNGDNEDSETDADVSAGDSETLEAEFVDPSQFVG